MNTITAKEIEDVVGDKFFHVSFVKKDGSIRDMAARTGVYKYVKGTGRPIDDGRLSVWEPSLDGQGAEKYRSLWPETIIELKCGDKVIKHVPFCPLEMQPKRKK